ncbi:hypothetical protein E4U21_001585, partial [Claviceps maximensis]
MDIDQTSSDSSPGKSLSSASHNASAPSPSGDDVLYDGNLAFTRVKGGNGSEETYQEAVGAPVERNSPLGYHVGWVTIIFLNVNSMVGTGVFST